MALRMNLGVLASLGTWGQPGLPVGDAEARRSRRRPYRTLWPPPPLAAIYVCCGVRTRRPSRPEARSFSCTERRLWRSSYWSTLSRMTNG